MNNIKQILPELTEIKNYTPALKIDDKYFVNGIGGNYIPGGTSNSMDFYKCASVDTTNKTYTDYKAIQDTTTDVYSFEQNITSVLTYLNIIPQINKIYSENTKISMPYLYDDNIEGIIARYPLTNNANDYSGNNNHGTIYGNLQFTNSGVYGFNYSNYITLPISLIGTPFTICMWLYQYQQNALYNWRVLLRVGETNCFYSTSYNNLLGLCVDSTETRSDYGDFRTSPIHVATTWNPETDVCQNYKNGIKIGTYTYSNKSWKDGILFLGKAGQSEENYYADKFKIRDVLFANKILTSDEIIKIMNQNI